MEKLNAMKAKYWFWTTIALTCAILFVIARFMMDIDPYFHYHGPIEDRPYALYGGGAYEKYYNDGIGKHFEYDIMITGSSVTENFKASQAEVLWSGTVVKTCFAGGTLKEIDEHVKRSIKANDDLKIVIRGIDENKLLTDMNAYPQNAPTYLYDDNPFNDVKYLFDKDTWFTPLKRNLELMKYDWYSTNFDQYANWTSYITFSKDVTLSAYNRPEVSEKQEMTVEELTNIQGNIEQNIVSTVRENPDVTFYYFLTPTSVLQWDEWIRNGIVEQQLVAERILIENLLQYENVKLFGFSDGFELITNLDNYMDVEHFSDDINAWLLQEMSAGRHQLTKDNYEKYLNDISAFYGTFDYEGLFK